MIETMSKAKVMLIPSSVLSFEAMALRKPIFTCYFVDNQKLIHEGLVELDLAKGIGFIDNIDAVNGGTKDFLDYYSNDKLYAKQLCNQEMVLDGKSDVRLKEIIADNLNVC